MKKTIQTAVFLLLSALSAQAQSVAFPDDTRTRGYYDRPYKRYEAEPCHSTGNGVYLPQTFDQREIQSEASNQQAVQLINNGDYVQWINAEAADGLTIRFSIPDNAAGTGTTGTVALYVNDEFIQNITLNSKWAWQYVLKNGDKYPENIPDASTKFARMPFDETRVKLENKIPAGATFKIQKADDAGATYTIDFVELENIPAKTEKPTDAVEYTGNGSNLADFVNSHGGQNIYIPEGTFDVPNKIYINSDNTKLIGAGMWYTELHFTAAPDGNDYNKRGIESNKSNLLIDGLYLTTESERRYKTYHNSGQGSGKALGGSFGSNSVIKNVWAVHFECGAWIADYSSSSQVSDNLLVQHCRFRGNYADGINLCKGTKNAIVEHTSFRNNGDDDMASWSQNNQATENNTFQYNTSENCWRAAGIGFFGGKQNKALNCVIIDPTEEGVRANNDFDAAAFSGDGYFEIRNISIYRAGTKAGNVGQSGDLWGNRAAALRLNSSSNRYDVRNFKFSNMDIYDSKGDAVIIQGNGAKSLVDVTLESININGVNKSTAGNDWTYFGLCFLNAKGTDNEYCIHYYNVPEDLKTYQVPAVGFTEIFGCAENSDVLVTALCASNQTIKVGEKLDLAALTTVLPASATDKSLTFAVVETAGANSVSLAADGTVTGATEGEAVVKISSAANEDVYTEITITVQGFAVTGITLDTLNLTLNVGETYQLTPIFTPANADNQNVTWSGGNTTASVSATGLVTALQVNTTGVANIRVTTEDGGYYKVCVVRVTDPTAVIDTKTNELKIAAYGNTIQINGQTNGEIISIYNLLGTKVFSQKMGNGAKNIRGLRSGVYTVVAEKARVVKKVIINLNH